MIRDPGSTVTVFGSSATPPGHVEYEEARHLGFQLARAGYTVCSGGYGGVMEAVSLGAKEGGGQTLGITSRIFSERSGANAYIDEEVLTVDLYERITRAIEAAETHVAMPGGPGTLAEIGLTWNLRQRNLIPHRGPFVLVGEVWGDLYRSFHSNPWIRPRDIALIQPAANAEEAFRIISNGSRENR